MYSSAEGGAVTEEESAKSWIGWRHGRAKCSVTLHSQSSTLTRVQALDLTSCEEGERCEVGCDVAQVRNV
jgi:hypothetical protein